MNVAFDAKGFEMKFVVFYFDLTHLLFQLLVLETVFGCIALDGDGGGVGFGFGFDGLGCGSGDGHGCYVCAAVDAVEWRGWFPHREVQRCRADSVEREVNRVGVVVIVVMDEVGERARSVVGLC